MGPNGEVKGGWDAETIAELTAEYRRQSNIRGYTISRWYKRSGRPNHRLDCMVYALAALSLSRLKIDDCEVQRVEARNVGENEAKKNAAAVKWARRRWSRAAMLVLAAWPDLGQNLLIVRSGPDLVRFREVASASDIGSGATVLAAVQVVELPNLPRRQR